MTSLLKKLIVLGVVVGAILWVRQAGLEQYLSPSYYQGLFAEAPFLTAGIYFVVYILSASFPIAALLTLVGAAVFGFWWGLLIISFASSLGATLAFTVSRFFLKDWVQDKFGNYLKTINQGIEKDGAFYLLSLRLIPLFPFFAINLVMGLTPMRTFTFYWISQLGMLAGTAVYVYAGAQLGQVEELSVKGIFTPELIFAFTLLGIFPWIVRGIFKKIERSHKLKGFTKPKKFDDNVIAIGAGAAGLVTSYIAAATKAKVTLIEKHKMGGDCLNTGCVPSKAILHAASQVKEIERAKSIGIEAADVKVDFQRVMESVHESIAAIEPHDSVERYTGLGVNVIEGEAEILSPWEVKVNGEVRSAKNLVLAMGGRPRVPEVPGIEEMGYYTSDTLWEMKQQPKHLIVLGGGPIGSELSQAFKRLGSQVTIIEPAPQLLGREDADVADVVSKQFEEDGIEILLNHLPKQFQLNNGVKSVTVESNGQSKIIEFDTLIVATGRQANTGIKGLDKLGIELDERGFVKVDEYLETSVPGVYACGDLIGGYQFTHVSAHEAWYAVVNAMFGIFKRFKADYRVIPWATYTDPEVGRVGLSELDAKAKDIDVEVHRYEMHELDRAIVEHNTKGFVKVLTEPGTDKILGATVVGLHAGELVAEFVMAMKHGMGLNKLLGTIHAYPTLMEANKYVAGVWKKSSVSESTLNWVEKFQTWRRG